MELERGQKLRITVSVSAVGAFVVLLILIGLIFDTGGSDPAGGLAFIAAIAAFVLGMAGAGVYLAREVNET